MRSSGQWQAYAWRGGYCLATVFRHIGFTLSYAEPLTIGEYYYCRCPACGSTSSEYSPGLIVYSRRNDDLIDGVRIPDFYDWGHVGQEGGRLVPEEWFCSKCGVHGNVRTLLEWVLCRRPPSVDSPAHEDEIAAAAEQYGVVESPIQPQRRGILTMLAHGIGVPESYLIVAVLGLGWVAYLYLG